MYTILQNQSSRLSLKDETEKFLFLSIIFTSGLLASRILYTGQIKFIFLEWNLFLAIVPYVISRLVWRNRDKINNQFIFAILFFLWIIFIPNSFYIITDLFHLPESSDVPLWFDLLLLLSFAWNGLVLGVLSVRQMEKTLQKKWNNSNEFLFLFPIMWLNALGVYIGRYLRFNSWDIVTSPVKLLMDITNLLAHPLNNLSAFGMVLSYSIFMTLFYLSIKKMSRRV